ncbi:MAG: hypothetical protein U0X76_08500 [Bacteroidia bacterium]
MTLTTKSWRKSASKVDQSTAFLLSMRVFMSVNDDLNDRKRKIRSM